MKLRYLYKKIIFFIIVYLIQISTVYLQNDKIIKVSNIEADNSFLSTEIVNRHDFQFLINPGTAICGENRGLDVFLLVYVHTAPKYFKRRLAIRETWGNRLIFPNIRVVYMMGDVTDNEIVNELVKYESNTYGDIVKENFLDSYRNLTYKGVMALKWVSTYCSLAKFVLKVDDDIIVNMFSLLKHLKVLNKHKMVAPKTVLCNVWNDMPVMRENSNKWYVGENEYASDTYGQYCSGSAYLFTPDLLSLMYEKSKYVRFFWVDDYYITGILVRAVDGKYHYINSLYVINEEQTLQRLIGKKSDYSFFAHVATSNLLRVFYKSWYYIVHKKLNSYSSIFNENSTDYKYRKPFKWQ